MLCVDVFCCRLLFIAACCYLLAFDVCCCLLLFVVAAVVAVLSVAVVDYRCNLDLFLSVFLSYTT